ncbi:hypothetical protein F5878DRAFT_24090 [Lentinula raphanica]|uniref:DUF6534 domain-containing protein n=1 Tax=Lentinula raphanica TaxID=153919 RepID=A0AA38NX04_9AGAR|nr:hypothetical protein F5878DRAFT_24090 [Lentinula raphanica]
MGFTHSTALTKQLRVTIAALTVCLALLTFAISMVIFVRTIPSIHSGPSVFTPTAQDSLDWKIQLPSAIACDLVITLAMVYNLYKSRTGLKKTDHVLNMLIIFTVNTGLITVVLSTASLICFLVLPQSILIYVALYVALETILPKCYLNSFLATLNSREFLREQMSTEITDRTIENLSAKSRTLHFDRNPDLSSGSSETMSYVRSTGPPNQVNTLRET